MTQKTVRQFAIPSLAAIAGGVTMAGPTASALLGTDPNAKGWATSILREPIRMVDNISSNVGDHLWLKSIADRYAADPGPILGRELDRLRDIGAATGYVLPTLTTQPYRPSSERRSAAGGSGPGGGWPLSGGPNPPTPTLKDYLDRMPVPQRPAKRDTEPDSPISSSDAALAGLTAIEAGGMAGGPPGLLIAAIAVGGVVTAGVIINAIMKERRNRRLAAEEAQREQEYKSQLENEAKRRHEMRVQLENALSEMTEKRETLTSSSWSIPRNRVHLFGIGAGVLLLAGAYLLAAAAGQLVQLLLGGAVLLLGVMLLIIWRMRTLAWRMIQEGIRDSIKQLDAGEHELRQALERL